MSQTESSRLTPNNKETPRVAVGERGAAMIKGSAEKNCVLVESVPSSPDCVLIDSVSGSPDCVLLETISGSPDCVLVENTSISPDCVLLDSVSSSPVQNVKERVLKEVGFTSATFIGPAFPPEKKTAARSAIEDELSDFYKELEQIDTPDGVSDSKEKEKEVDEQPTTSTNTPHRKEAPEKKEEQTASKETDGPQRSSGQKQSSWPHWYKNEPYYPRRPRPDLDQNFGRNTPPPQNEWHHPQKPNRPQSPRFLTPPFRTPLPPPPSFPNPQNPPLHPPPGNQTQRGPRFNNQHQEDSYFPPFPHVPPPRLPPSQDVYRPPLPHFDRDERAGVHDAHANNVNFEWSTDRREEWSEFREDYDWRHRNDSQNEVLDHQRQHPENSNPHQSPMVLILMRGLPGSGKSTMARKLLSTGPSGLILSTDDYFAQSHGYRFEGGRLGAAHDWNQRRARDAMHDGRSPVIIDNTNLQAWEMKPYVKMAIESGYRVDFCEPNTSWKFDPYELGRRNTHNVPQETIAQMMDRFSSPISIDIVMRSQEPPHVKQSRKPDLPRTTRRDRDYR